jgi:hypothetical protein
MTQDINIRKGWLKGMYIYTIVGAGGFGLGIIFAPDVIGTMFSMAGMPMPRQDPFILGITGSVYLSFALLSILDFGLLLNLLPFYCFSLVIKLSGLLASFFPPCLQGDSLHTLFY